MVKSKPKEMNKLLKLVLIFVIVALFLGALYYWFILDAQNKIERITGGEEITSSELALTLLNQEDVEKAINLEGSVFPLIPQFNDKLASDDVETYGYTDLSARLIMGKSGAIIIENVITLFDTEEQAQNFLAKKAEESNAKITKSFNETVSTLYQTYPIGEDNPPIATIRFVIKNLVAKITVYGDNPTIDYTNAELLGALVIPLATKQKEKMEQLLSGKLPGNINVYETNMAFNNFPDTLNGAELIGMNHLTQEEWMAETGKFNQDALSGFQSGAVGNFKLSNMPGHVVSIVILEFESKADALREQNSFFEEGVHIEDPSSEELELPETINEFSMGRISDNMAEIQAVHRVYLYDIAIFSPFEEFDKVNARKATAKYAEELLG